MRDINSNILTELEKQELRPFLLLDMEIDSTHYRYTDCDVPIVFDGNTYSPRGFSFDRVSYGAHNIVDSVEIALDNLDSVMTSIFVGGTPQGSIVTLKLIIVTADNDIYYMPVSTEGLVGYWPFDDGSGSTAKDKSGNGNDGTLQNMEEADWVDGIAGKCLSFNDTGERVTLGTSIGAAGYTTISLWYKRTADGASNYRSLLADITANIHHLIIEGPGTTTLGLWDGSGHWFSYSIPDDGEFHHYAVVYNSGSTADLYVDGVWNSQVNHSLNFSTNKIGSIGNWSDGNYYAGPVDEVRIYNRALTDHEIKALYNLAYGSATTFEGIIDSWDLDEEKVAITVTSIFSQWSQRTLSKHSASCRWKKFKGTECGYSGGETWCDRTYARCVALGNTANFGGFRWLPSIIDKEIWWGRLRGA